MTLRVVSASSTSSKVTLLVLGAGWTYQFLQPLLVQEKISHAATTTTGHDGTIQFRFDPDSDDLDGFKKLPDAKYVLVTFPLKGKGPSARLVDFYNKTHAPQAGTETEVEAAEATTKWIQLGSTGIFTGSDWNDSSSPIDESNERGVAENELLSLGGCVLNLAGLYGGSRQPRNWISRVAKTKEQLAAKGALHLIHGVDVARGIVAMVKMHAKETTKLFGRRWIVADCVSYDWWCLVWDLMGESAENENRHGEQGEIKDGNETQHETEEGTKYRRWIMELMEENGIRGLPRPMDALGRKLDARDFWKAIGISPTRSLAR